MRKNVILTSVSAAGSLFVVGSAASGGDRRDVRVAHVGSGTLTTSARNNGGPVVRGHRSGRGHAEVRDHRSGSSQSRGSHPSRWADGAKVRDHRKPIVELKGPF